MALDVDGILEDIKETFEDGEKIITADCLFPKSKRKQASRTYIVIHTDRRELFLKYAPEAKSGEFKKEYEALKKVSSEEFVTPKPIKVFNKGIVVSKVSGNLFNKMISECGLSQEVRLLVRQAITHLSSFHIENTRRVLMTVNLDDLYKDLTGAEISAETRGFLGQANIGFTHGDFDPFNILLLDKKTPGLFGLVDWEDFRENGIQELDALHFVTMLCVILNPNASHKELFEIMFKKQGSFYLDLLKVYCDKRKTSLSEILKIIPVYCDTQNHRLTRAHRNTDDFLYNDFKKIYHEP